MALTPTGPLTLPLYNMQTLLANSAAFQTWITATGTPTEKLAAARARIYLGAASSVTLPCAVINIGDEWTAGASSGGARNHFETSGTLFLAFEAAVGATYQADNGQALIEFANTVGAIIGQMEALSGSDGYLVVSRIAKHSGPMRVAVAEAASLGDYFAIEFEITWGEVE